MTVVPLFKESECPGCRTLQAEYSDLHERLEEMAGELAAARTALTREHNANSRLRRKLDAIRGLNVEQAKEVPDGDVILRFLAWWRDYTGRPANTVVDLASSRASLVRRALKHWTPQELCWMVIGMCRDEWYVAHEKTDIKHMLKDEAIAERFLRLGRPA